jgi:pimeloyl-ACP methyl ester carboxylesterase
MKILAFDVKRPIMTCLFLALMAKAGRCAELENRFAPFEHIRVHYQMKGNGAEGLVFVHGWAGSAEFWREQAAGFPSTPVIVVDLPGHGQSDKPRTDYTIEYFARSIAAVMRDAKLKRAVLVGHSMGAPIVGRFYGPYPKKTLGLVIVDGAMKPFLPKDQMDKMIRDLGSDYASVAPAVIDSMLMPIKDAELKRDIRATMLSTPDYVGISAMRGMADEKAYARGPIKVPVLAVLAKSHNWSPGTDAFLRSLAPSVEIHMWDGVSHFLMMERPREFDQALRDFLSKNKLLTTAQP